MPPAPRPAPPPAKPALQGRKIVITIDVMADGLHVVLWRGSERNASYARVDKVVALSRVLPEAIDEAIAFAAREDSDAHP